MSTSPIEQLLNSGIAALQAQDLSSADRCFRQIVSRYPGHAPAWNGLAWTSLRAGQPDIALGYAEQAHKLDRRRAEYLNTLAVACGELADLSAAEAHLRKALKLSPAYVDGLVNLGKVLQKQGRQQEALRSFERAYKIDSEFPNLAVTMARLHREAGEAERALALLERCASSIDPQQLALALSACDVELHGAQAGAARLRRAVEDHPDWRLARLSLAHLLLAIGAWREGWEQYRWRSHLDARSIDAAERLPEDLAGARVLLRGEQGIGDVLFFLRFAPLVAACGGTLEIACDRKLHVVLSETPLLAGIHEPQKGDATRPGFHRRLWLGDLPTVLGCETTPAAWPLHAAEAAREAARQRLAALGPAPYLALTWRAGTDVLRGAEFGADRTALMKEVPLAALGEALRGWGGTVLALQRAPTSDELRQVASTLRAPVHDLSALNENLADMVAVLSVVDEYVAVSNTNVHLVAGLGRTCRVLVPYPPEWRWMHSEGESAWFPGFPTYREPQSRGWSAPLARLRKDLIG